MWLKFCADFEFHVGNFPPALILVVLDTYFSGGKPSSQKIAEELSATCINFLVQET